VTLVLKELIKHRITLEGGHNFDDEESRSNSYILQKN